MKALILAAGLGTRLRPITDNRPKVMTEIGGRPVLEHLLRLCVYHGIKEAVINLHYLPEIITNYFGDGRRLGINIIYSDETKQLMGGAGAIKQAARWLQGEDFLVLNGDVLTNANLTEILAFHQAAKALGTFLVHTTDHPFDSDLVRLQPDGKIIEFFRPQINDEFTPLAKSGVHVFSPKVFRLIPPGKKYSLERELIPNLLKLKQPLYAYKNDCYAKDIGNLHRLDQARKDYDLGVFTLPQ